MNNGQAMVHAKDVVKFYGEFQALCGVSMDIQEGEVVVICGPSGLLCHLATKILPEG
jgi:ABC-type polar amino acid transport system ATPase subunit